MVVLQIHRYSIPNTYPPSEMHLLFKFYQILLNYSHHCTVGNSNFLQTNLESPGKITFYKESAALNSSERIQEWYEWKKMQNRHNTDKKCQKLQNISYKKLYECWLLAKKNHTKSCTLYQRGCGSYAEISWHIQL